MKIFLWLLLILTVGATVVVFVWPHILGIWTDDIKGFLVLSFSIFFFSLSGLKPSQEK